MATSIMPCNSRLALLLLLVRGAIAETTTYVANMGQYGTFEMEISADDGTMTWKSDLSNLDELALELGLEAFPTLNYHLHQSWSDTEADYAIGADACGPAVTGGHYDPFFACGPASGVDADTCLAIDRERTSDRYVCSTAYAINDYSQCEVGDLSGKDGALVIENGAVSKRSVVDPLAAQNTHFVAGTTSNPPDRFASIVYHDGSPRVLCARLFLAEDAPVPPPSGDGDCEITGYELWDDDIGLVDADLTSGKLICNPLFPSGYNIRVVAPGCDTIEMELDGAQDVLRTERSEPYFLFGDIGGDPYTRSLSTGSYLLETTGDAGVVGETLQFDVSDDVSEFCS